MTAKTAAAAALNIFDENNAKYAKTVDAGTETNLYQALKEAWSGYLAASAQLRELLAADKLADAKIFMQSNQSPARHPGRSRA